MAEVDAEAVRSTLKEILSNLATAERDRDEAQMLNTSLKQQLKDLEEMHHKTEQKLQQLMKAMADLEEEKRNLEAKLGTSQTTLMMQDETVKRLERERKAQGDKISNLEQVGQAKDTDIKQLTVRDTI